MWEYRARVTRVVDGDTIDVVTDLGFGMDGLAMRLRLLGIDTPEITGDTAAEGIVATRFTTAWLVENQDAAGYVLITTVRDRRDRDQHDSFGRYLAVVWNMAHTANLNEALITSGNTTGRYQ